MFEIKSNYPQFQVSKNVKLSVGDIADLQIEDNQVVVTKSKGVAPIGFITSVFADGSNPVNSWNNPAVLTATVEFRRFVGYTDQYETTQVYPTNAHLYVSEAGLLTTRRPSENHPSVGMVIQGPSPISAALQFLWL